MRRDESEVKSLLKSGSKLKVPYKSDHFINYQSNYWSKLDPNIKS